MALVEISMRGFAEVVSAPPARKRTVLKRFRSPNAGESVGRSNYYVKALSVIKRHHRGDFAYVTSTLRNLLVEAEAATEPRQKAKLLNNHRAITEYLKHFGNRALSIKSGKRLYYTGTDIIISARPDLVAEEDGKLLLIKLNLSKHDFPGGVVSTLLHVLHEAARLKQLSVATANVECLQVSSGTRIKGPRSGFPDKQVLDRACKEIVGMCSD